MKFYIFLLVKKSHVQTQTSSERIYQQVLCVYHSLISLLHPPLKIVPNKCTIFSCEQLF